MEPEGKLVRDRIPEIILASGGQVQTRELSWEERLPALLDKLVEEAEELRIARTTAERVEEIADVLEVLRGIASHIGVDWAAVDEAAGEKLSKRGGFARGIWLNRPADTA